MVIGTSSLLHPSTAHKRMLWHLSLALLSPKRYVIPRSLSLTSDELLQLVQFDFQYTSPAIQSSLPSSTTLQLHSSCHHYRPINSHPFSIGRRRFCPPQKTSSSSSMDLETMYKRSTWPQNCRLPWSVGRSPPTISPHGNLCTAIHGFVLAWQQQQQCNTGRHFTARFDRSPRHNFNTVFLCFTPPSWDFCMTIKTHSPIVVQTIIHHHRPMVCAKNPPPLLLLLLLHHIVCWLYGAPATTDKLDGLGCISPVKLRPC